MELKMNVIISIAFRTFDLEINAGDAINHWRLCTVPFQQLTMLINLMGAFKRKVQ